ncbi:hypothetical protein Dsin_015086 [Dipteronia sinensis]|uniref:Vacuolar ATPase assembly integral membrane protein VMA21 homolog n=1 Tax=Dipteronia sinensis TaxID=43782 RepID=A0AAE0AN63_9ROSI|nr:hypothetical protein Dsin_015086 [Dipteronia sinensis]
MSQCYNLQGRDFVTRVNEITSGKGVDVVYDSVGKDTFQGSLECLKIRGYMVSFGQSSGTPDPVPLSALAPKSLFLTRPSLMHYTTNRDELLETAGEVFANVASGVLRAHVNHTYPLSQAAQAHADLESRKTSGLEVNNNMAAVITKFFIASMIMWIAPLAILFGFNNKLLPGSTDLSPYSKTLLSGFLAVISVNIVIVFYIYMALKEPSDKHEPDPAFLAEAKASVNQST